MVLPDLLCMSVVRWKSMGQRTQQLMRRFARERRVFFIEPPVVGFGPVRFVVERTEEGVTVAVPHCAPPEHEGDERASGGMVDAVRELLRALLAEHSVADFAAWFDAPDGWRFAHDLPARVVVYDCPGELHEDAPQHLRDAEVALTARADLLFTAGRHHFEQERTRHPNLHLCPTTADVAHFAKARTMELEPGDMTDIRHPRLGFFGVIDQRVDLPLLGEMARARPEWQFVMVGPLVGNLRLPRSSNIHWMSPRPYAELPRYLAAWDIALLPFACTRETRFLNPHQTPESLAAHRPVVATPLREVVHPYGELGLVDIADGPAAFLRACAAALGRTDRAAWRQSVDDELAPMSWEATWSVAKEQLDAAWAASGSGAEFLAG